MPGGALTSFEDSLTDQEHVFYRTRSGPSNTLWHLSSNGPGMPWSGESLHAAMQSVKACAFADESSLTSFDDGNWNVFYINSQSKHVCWLYNNPNGQGGWMVKDLGGNPISHELAS